jgi:hypothetical protein
MLANVGSRSISSPDWQMVLIAIWLWRTQPGHNVVECLHALLHVVLASRLYSIRHSFTTIFSMTTSISAASSGRG